MRGIDGHRIRGVGLMVAAIALLAGLAVPAPGRANAGDAATVDSVIEWNTHATDALIGVGLQTPPVSALHLAMVHGAIYDAVNAIDGGYQPYLEAPPARPWYSVDAAVAAAAHGVLVHLLPDQEAALDGLYQASLDRIADGDAKSYGIETGEEAAEEMIAERADDGRFGPFRFTEGSEVGEWRTEPPLFLSDPNAWVARVQPFLVESRSQFRSNGPDPLTSEAYAVDFNEVKSLGSLESVARTEDQTDMALFWSEHAAAMWSRIVRTLAAARDLSTADNARLFALLYLTGADALITCWADKARWSFWRPITAIHEARHDGNPDTRKDEDWAPLLPTPPYPEHSSGHSCFSGSVVHTLRDFFGTNEIAFEATSTASGTTRTFQRATQAIKEVLDARVYAGIHFRNADNQGARIGRQVARWREHHYFQPAA